MYNLLCSDYYHLTCVQGCRQAEAEEAVTSCFLLSDLLIEIQFEFTVSLDPFKGCCLLCLPDLAKALTVSAALWN